MKLLDKLRTYGAISHGSHKVLLCTVTTCTMLAVNAMAAGVAYAMLNDMVMMSLCFVVSSACILLMRWPVQWLVEARFVEKTAIVALQRLHFHLCIMQVYATQDYDDDALPLLILYENMISAEGIEESPHETWEKYKQLKNR